jgi:hypothetical protein
MKLTALPPVPTPAYRSVDLAYQKQNHANNYQNPAKCYNHRRDRDKIPEHNQNNPDHNQGLAFFRYAAEYAGG